VTLTELPFSAKRGSILMSQLHTRCRS
jgi:hypothetical protein